MPETVTLTDPSWTFQHLSSALVDLDVPPWGVIHVGAHWGEEVPIYKAVGFQEIVLVEPDPESSFQMLAQPWYDSSIHLYRLAVTSSRHPVASFYQVPGGVWSGLKPAGGKHRPTSQLEVPTVRVDQLQVTHPECNVLVVDTQGTELDALASADLSKLDLAIVETHERGRDAAHPAELQAYVQAMGWRVAIVWDRTQGWTDTLIVPAASRG